MIHFSFLFSKDTLYCADPNEIVPLQTAAVHKDISDCSVCSEDKVRIGKWIDTTGSYVNRKLQWVEKKMVMTLCFLFV